MYAYYFRSDSGDEYLDFSDKDMTVGEAIMAFDWDNSYGWIDLGYHPDEIPYASFIKKQWDN